MALIRAGRLVLLLAGALCAQQTPVPRFETAVIKPTPPEQWNGESGGYSGKGRYSMHNRSLRRYIMAAYGVGPKQIEGGPAWVDSDRFDIEAKADEPVGDSVLMPMVQTLLADRFKLAIHRQSRLVNGYVLLTAKGGPKLEKAQGGSSSTSNSPGLIDARVITMNRFAEVLSRQMDYPVADQTDLEGAFNLKLEWSPKQPPADDTRPSIFTAIQQLGLRLQARKVPVEFIVIDRAERPSEN